MLLTRLAPLAAVAALAACSGGGEAGGNAAAGGNSATASESAEAPSGDDTPQVKAGVWEMAMTMPGPSGTPIKSTMKICVGEPKPGENPFAMKKIGNTTCSRSAVTRTAGGWSIDNECSGEGVTTKTKGTVTGDPQSAYKTVMTSVSSGPNVPAFLQKETTTEVDARYVGACPAGVQPGQPVT